MRPGIAAIFPLLVVLLALLTPVQAMTYLDSLAARRSHRSPSTTSGPGVTPRQAAGDLSNLYSCQNVTVNAPLNDTSCEVVQSSSGGLVGGLVTTLLCRPVVRDIVLITSSCTCVSAGMITPATRQGLYNFIHDPANNATGSNLYQLTSLRNGVVAYTADSLLTYLADSLPPKITDTTSCSYPSGSYPTCGGTCTYVCPASTRLCGNTCLADNRACISNVPQRRSLRDIKQVELDLRCPAGKSACALPQPVHGGSVFVGDRIECIDTRSDIESCGGCAFPLPGHRSGIDCTAIPHAGQVSCTAGTCQVHTCQPGYSLNGTDCTPTLRRRSSWKDSSRSDARAEVSSSEALESEIAPKVDLSVDASPDHVQVAVSADDVKARKAAGKKILSQRQLTTKQLVERRAKRVKRKSRWADMFD